MRGTKQLREETGAKSRDLRGLARRMLIKFTDNVLWQLTGHRLEAHTETTVAEVFANVGFFSRPRAGTKTAEAILQRIGDAQHVVIVATRDEDLRAMFAGDFADDDIAALFNSNAIMVIKGSTAEVKSRGGIALALAPVAELERLYAALEATSVALQAEIVLGNAAATPAKLAIDTLKTILDALVPAWPSGTTVLKGE
jgi:phage gp45-like